MSAPGWNRVLAAFCLAVATSAATVFGVCAVEAYGTMSPVLWATLSLVSLIEVVGFCALGLALMESAA